MKKKLTYIAELCQNHNGNFKKVEKMVYECALNGAKIAKLQYIFAKNLTYRPKFEKGYKIKLNNQIICRPYLKEKKRLKKLELKYKEYEKFIKLCEKNNIKPAITCFAREHIRDIYNLGFEYIKVASYDCASFQFLRELKKFKNIIVSTGATFDNEIKFTSKLLKNKKANFSLLHCVTKYPTPLDDLNLSRINYLKKYAVNVGYSDHSLSDETNKNYASMASIYFGGSILERHVRILDRNSSKDGPVSILPSDIKSIIEFSMLSKSDQKYFLEKECNLNLKKMAGKIKRNLTNEEKLNRDYYRGRFASFSNKDKKPIYNWEEIPL